MPHGLVGIHVGFCVLRIHERSAAEHRGTNSLHHGPLQDARAQEKDQLEESDDSAANYNSAAALHCDVRAALRGQFGHFLSVSHDETVCARLHHHAHESVQVVSSLLATCAALFSSANDDETSQLKSAVFTYLTINFSNTELKNSSYG